MPITSIDVLKASSLDLAWAKFGSSLLITRDASFTLFRPSA